MNSEGKEIVTDVEHSRNLGVGAEDMPEGHPGNPIDLTLDSDSE